MKLLLSIFFRVSALSILCTFAACSTSGARVVEHGFGFDVRRANPSIEILDYRYGASNFPVRAPDWAVKEGKKFNFNNVYGAMKVADFLYVKWRVENSPKIFEESVDLKSRIPADLKGQIVYLDINGSELSVYLISRKLRSAEDEKVGPEMYQSRVVRKIYP